MSETTVLLNRAYHRKYSFSSRRFPESVLFGDMLKILFGLESLGEWRACAARCPSERYDFGMVCTVC
jgi:hypothetical protein